MGFRFEFFSHTRNDICIFAVDVLVTFTEVYIYGIYMVICFFYFLISAKSLEEANAGE